MKAPTLFLFFLATLSSLVFARPLQQRNFNDFYGCMRRLSVDIDVFDRYADTIGLFLDVDGLLAVLEPILGGYEECDSALDENGPLSEDEAQKSIAQYDSSSKAFSNGLNRVNAPRRTRNRNGPGLIDAQLNAFGARLRLQVGRFGNNLRGRSPRNGTNQKRVDSTTNGLQDSITNALGN
ncbi:hypothetical protein AX14_014274 [Amanita brunnescens Koide BX004]|nr:hypothetical protein AX14_014274 [Amanita brunnescens Koide BX004]